MPEFPTMGQGPGYFIDPSSLDQELDDLGFTNPNLHRRIDPQEPTTEGAVAPNSYVIGIYGKNSHRTVTLYLHDEESTTSEIP